MASSSAAHLSTLEYSRPPSYLLKLPNEILFLILRMARDQDEAFKARRDSISWLDVVEDYEAEDNIDHEQRETFKTLQ